MTTILDKGSFQFPTASGAQTASDQATMDAAVQTLQARKDAWVEVSVRERIALIDRLIHDFHALQDRWVAACLHAKGLTAQSPAAGEEWATGAYATLKHLRVCGRVNLEIDLIARYVERMLSAARA